jgi:outer membrane protein assembly factor BamB
VKEKRIVTAITISTILVFTGVVVGWHLYTPRDGFTVQAPGADNRPAGQTRAANDVLIGEFFMKYDDASSQLTGKWCGFRGKASNNIIKTSETVNISTEDYTVAWSVETGEGHAAPVIYNGRFYFLDYDEKLSSDALRCFSLKTGKELWRRWYRVPMKRNHGFSRTVPAIGDGYIITIGPEGHVMCCDPLSGELKWSLNMQKEFKTEVPFWYTGQCPHVDNSMLILAPAGEDVLLAGLDCLTGEIAWTTPNTLQYKMSHSSVMPMTMGGKRMYVYIGVGGICGVSAEAGEQGTLLWNADKWQPSVVAPSPVQISADKVFLVAGYGTGGALLQVNRAGSKWTAAITEQHKPNEGLSSEQQTPIFYNNMLISVMPKDGGGHRGKLVCYSPSNLRQPVWTSAADERFGLGPYLLINNNLFVFKDDGELYVYQVQQQSMKLLKKQRIIDDGTDAWGPLAYADGMLIVRDAHRVKGVRIVDNADDGSK